MSESYHPELTVHGKPRKRARYGSTVEERFWFFVYKTDTCWLWSGHMRPFGYGRIYVRKRLITAHRFAYELLVGKIPRGMKLLHKCDVPQCVNPDHLFVGTQADNVADMWKKGRANPVGVLKMNGPNHPSTKLSWSKVRAIREAHRNGADKGELAYQYGLSWSCIHHVIVKKTWKIDPGAE